MNKKEKEVLSKVTNPPGFSKFTAKKPKPNIKAFEETISDICEPRTILAFNCSQPSVDYESYVFLSTREYIPKLGIIPGPPWKLSFVIEESIGRAIYHYDVRNVKEIMLTIEEFKLNYIKSLEIYEDICADFFPDAWHFNYGDDMQTEMKYIGCNLKYIIKNIKRVQGNYEVKKLDI